MNQLGNKNKLIQLQNRVFHGNPEVNTVRQLYLVMDKVGGYEQLINLPIPALNEILQCMEWEAKEMKKSNRRKR